MGNEEEDSFDDVSSLMEKIGGKKKEAASDGQKNGPDSPVAPAHPEQPAKPTSGGGDFSQLMKKLGMANRKNTVSPSAPDTPTISLTPAEPEPAPAYVPEPGPVSPPISSLDDLLEDETPPSPVTAPVEAGPEPVMEIIEEDTRPSIRKGLPAKKAKILPKQKSPSEPETDEDEKIITVDQISDISGLILPKGATFQVDELNLHGRVSAFEGTGIGALPDEFAEIWKKEFSKAGFKDLDLGDAVIAEKENALPAAKKFSISGLFAAIRTEEEEYDAKKHGPLVDLSFSPKSGIEEMEMYPVNEPYAYIRIIYDHSTHEYTYQVLEPVLTEPEKDLLKELKERLFDTLDINTKDLTRDEARLKLRAATNDIMQDFGIRLSPSVKEKIHYNMHKDFLGDGLIDPIMHDKYIEDISCDGVHTPIFAFHSSYESMKTSLAYHKAEDLDSFVTKLAQRAGKYISIAEPILDASMQDGSRIQMTLGTEVTAHGSTFTIRKFKDEPITPTDLIEWHTFAPLSIAYIWLAVENGKSAIFAGGTASGKTTALNAISLFIPPMAKIVSLEDTREVKLPHPNWIPSVTRDSFDTSGRGEINMYELLRAAMRQRPEYIIVGEVRGKECQTLFQAMSTGHVTYSTTHADSVASVVHRIENPPMDVPRNMLSALDFICIQVQARVGGKRIRRNKQIVEILDIDPRTNELITNEVFKWRSATDEHSYSGKSYVLEEIMEAKGWNENRMREELKRRQEVLEWMRIKKIRHYKDVAKILISYYRDPEVVIERVRKDLYE
ncbi:MAG: Flp pilus assembly complex ATPase component TadA [Methanoregula sp.]|uniref:ATPase, T2SS/T4P/T4SS family n=1 Tax=Methanoregula sp. TaxID=2052170 RepID=UPI0025CD29FE|nr:ATPase, T2SS/T4P/T4SS family [Methanoregula sp.]MCK9630073.1 Flp pilus assembly complex ATPase component TadA [Methanoregula sp.]